MSDTLSQEIFREELPFFRSVCLSISKADGVKMDAQDMGDLVKEVWHDSDYEFWVEVPATESQALLFALLKEKFEGRRNCVDEFKSFCKNHKIRFIWDSWA